MAITNSTVNVTVNETNAWGAIGIMVTGAMSIDDKSTVDVNVTTDGSIAYAIVTGNSLSIPEGSILEPVGGTVKETNMGYSVVESDGTTPTTTVKIVPASSGTTDPEPPPSLA